MCLWKISTCQVWWRWTVRERPPANPGALKPPVVSATSGTICFSTSSWPRFKTWKHLNGSRSMLWHLPNDLLPPHTALEGNLAGSEEEQGSHGSSYEFVRANEFVLPECSYSSTQKLHIFFKYIWVGKFILSERIISPTQILTNSW